jgi:hypothetical protein
MAGSRKSNSYENRITTLHPSCVRPIKGRSGSGAFPLDGKEPALSAVEGLDRGDAL